MPLPEGPGINISVASVSPPLVAPRINNHVLVVTDHFSRRADMLAVTAAEDTGERTANILAHKYIPL